MRQICLTLFGCLCLLIQGYCDDRDDGFFYTKDDDVYRPKPDELFRVAICDDNIASCKALLETGKISEDTVDRMFFNALFGYPEYPDERSIATRIDLVQLLAKYLPPDKDSWIQRWMVTPDAFPVMHLEIWKILTSSITSRFSFYPKCFLVNCIVRKQCYETYSDYPRFLDQMLEDFDIHHRDNELSSFLPQVEALQAYIDFCNANDLGFSSQAEISQFIEKTYIPTGAGRINGLFSGFIALIDDELGLILNPTTKANLLM
ncbi:MAG TPA: hypothetical protein VGO47_01685, partial [Chlamydiales bacterium]|nr:hypothetical protein [Chlamydiales bacterium]